MTKYEAEAVEHLTRLTLDQKRAEMISYLQARGFTPKAAAKAIQSYIDTQAFVAREIAMAHM